MAKIGKPVERRQESRREAEASTVQIEQRQAERRSGDDRRRDPRIPLELWMEELSGDDVYFRRSGNISAGGVYFDRAIPHELGTEITLKFTLPGDRHMVVARGKVVTASKEKGLGMGVQFISIEGDGKSRIQGFIDTANIEPLV